MLGTALVLVVGLSGCASVSKKFTSGKKELSGSYPIVDSNQGLCYDNYNQIDAPAQGDSFYGQDAQYTGNVPNYTDNGDGTVTDNVTGLIWSQELSRESMSWSEALAYCKKLKTGKYKDWRLPTVKELWSIRDYSQGWPWIDTDYFHLVGDGSEQRQHHSWTSNLYLVKSEYQNQQVQGDPAFIVNDWTGHIKAMSGARFVRAVRGNTNYGNNDFVDNGDATVSDNATGLMWAQNDNGKALNWEDALEYANNATIAGYTDWRLPNVKEINSIADYSGVFPSMNTNYFNLTELTNAKGQKDYPFYWTSTSNSYIQALHIEPGDTESDFVPGYTYAWIFAAGYCPDMEGNDLHGSGAIVFDSKSETVSDGSGREVFYHYVRLVRGGDVTETPKGDPATVKENRVVVFEDGICNMSGGRPGGQGGQQGGPEGKQDNHGGQQGGHGGPDFDAASEKLGITADAIRNALGEPGQGRPDFAAAAKKLGITEKELMSALGIQEGGRSQGGGPGR